MTVNLELIGYFLWVIRVISVLIGRVVLSKSYLASASGKAALWVHGRRCVVSFVGGVVVDCIDDCCDSCCVGC